MSAYVTWLMCLRNVVRRSAHTRSEIKKYRIAIREQVLIVLAQKVLAFTIVKRGRQFRMDEH